VSRILKKVLTLDDNVTKGSVLPATNIEKVLTLDDIVTEKEVLPCIISWIHHGPTGSWYIGTLQKLIFLQQQQNTRRLAYD
jgi:hypothetical protein